jgi:hypothetical protein
LIFRQLTHPLCSPILQGSLGGLCPLYIIAGEGEALRDEITYLAHRAARPEEYPARKGALQDSKRQRENVERFKTPTKVCEQYNFFMILLFISEFIGSLSNL